jgi:phosphoenolpyruvate carboxylase
VDALVRAAQVEALNGVLRFTEQGESIQQSYGLLPIAMRTLERAFHALTTTTSAARQGKIGSDRADHLEVAATVASVSRDAYRKLVHAAEFTEPVVTPSTDRAHALAPARHRQHARTRFRAVPLGVRVDAVPPMLPAGRRGRWPAAAPIASARLAFRHLPEWFFMRNLVDDVEAMLGRTDLEIASAYNALAPAQLHRFFAPIRSEYAAACENVLSVKRCAALLDSDPTLQRGIQLRNPYVDPMNLMQVDLLQRWRASERQDRDLFEALLASISGIAQGLQSTG